MEQTDTDSKAGVSCLKCMQLQLYAVVRLVYVVVIAVAVVAALNQGVRKPFAVVLAVVPGMKTSFELAVTVLNG